MDNEFISREREMAAQLAKANPYERAKISSKI